MTALNQIADNKGARKNRTIAGRGIGSGKGKTCGRGIKGQKSRSGVAIKGFEGGQMPIYRRLPKRGFNNPSSKNPETVNLGELQKFIDSKKIDASKPVTRETLQAAGLVGKAEDGIKLLGKGEIKAKVTIEVEAASEGAIKAIEKAGGKVTTTAPKEEEKRGKSVKRNKPSKSKAEKKAAKKAKSA